MRISPAVIPQVAIGFMNRDHSEFADLREQLLELLTSDVGGDEVDALLQRLLHHTKEHFAAEEQAMHEAGFPARLVHAAEHDMVLAEMSQHIRDWQEQKDLPSLRDWLDQTVGEWFLNHIRSMDFVTARFIAMKMQDSGR